MHLSHTRKRTNQQAKYYFSYTSDSLANPNINETKSGGAGETPAVFGSEDGDKEMINNYGIHKVSMSSCRSFALCGEDGINLLSKNEEGRTLIERKMSIKGCKNLKKGAEAVVVDSKGGCMD